jgi:serine-type D-Ala-D-Ala carboxypeptidase/endopeptidase (penicillin-binding protein 4)
MVPGKIRAPRTSLLFLLVAAVSFLRPSAEGLPSTLIDLHDLTDQAATHLPPSSLPDLPVSGPENPWVLEEVDSEILDLRLRFDGILASSAGRRGLWGVLAVSLDRGDTLISIDPENLLVPASNVKLFTTAAALHFLGPDFRYQTFLLADGPRREHVLDGDLVLYGTGDPTLSDRFFPSETAPMDSLARRVMEWGITEIRGNLVVDGSFFHGPDLHPDWDPRDLNDAFAAPVASLGFNENLVTVKVNPGPSVGTPAWVRAEPDGAGLEVLNFTRTLSRGSRSRVWLLRATPWDPIGIEGEIPLGSPAIWRSVPVPEPLLFTGLQLRRALEAQGIRVLGSVVVNRDADASRLSPSAVMGPTQGAPAPWILGTLSSPPLLEILRVINKRSNNLFAESVAKTLGRIVLGDGSYSGGQRVVEEFLVRQVGVDGQKVRVRDGSGLSTDNAATAGAFLQLLAFMERSPWWEDYWSTLPEAGVRGELGRMFRTPAERNLRAKTGTLRNVSALSGMVTTQAGERILFSILSNDVASAYGSKRVEDQLGARLASLTRPLP